MWSIIMALKSFELQFHEPNIKHFLVGELRFQPPQEQLPWPGVRNVVEQPNSCYQQVDLGSIIEVYC